MLSPYTGHLLKSVKRMAGAETKENGHISHSTISLNSKKKKRFTPRLKNLQFYYRERHAT